MYVSTSLCVYSIHQQLHSLTISSGTCCCCAGTPLCGAEGMVIICCSFRISARKACYEKDSGEVSEKNGRGREQMREGRANGRRVELMEREKGGETGGDGRRMVIQFCNMRDSIFCKHYPPRVYHLVLVVQPSWDLCQTGRLLHHSNVPQLPCNHIRPQLTAALYSGDVKVGDHSVVPTTYIIYMWWRK